MRIGLGWDLHTIEPGEGLYIGGVFIPCGYKTIAHSDGDVVLHALVDALLGAQAWGDIGEWFPDTNPAYKNAPSHIFLEEIYKKYQKAHIQIKNIDINYIGEVPKLTPYKHTIAKTIADLLHLDQQQVSVKAKTHEGVDAIGKKQAIAAQVVVLVEGP